MSTPKQLAEKIGIEYHQLHLKVQYARELLGYQNAPGELSWEAFLVCTHEICEDSRTLIEHLAKEPVV